eukprot:Nitzschia sp. Nitz4//scaffold111_size72815//41780//42082//NITZ4_005791-RA/size72815-processed-gene-0.54-mRNA-1//1//CDS//3329533183//762//frame0
MDTESGFARKRTHEASSGNAYTTMDEDTKPAGFMAPAEESHTRSLLKGFTWRVVATMSTVTIAWFVTGEVGQAFKIGLVEFFAKLAIYYVHERIWARIRI